MDDRQNVEECALYAFFYTVKVVMILVCGKTAIEIPRKRREIGHQQHCNGTFPFPFPFFFNLDNVLILNYYSILVFKTFILLIKTRGALSS